MPRFLLDEHDRAVLAALRTDDPGASSPLLARRLAQRCGKHVGELTIRRALASMGLSYRRRRGHEKYGSRPASRSGKPPTYLDGETARDLPERRAYPSDLTDAQWALIEPLVPKCKPGGRPEAHSRRELVDAMLYVLHNGCTWRALPHDLPPWPTVYTYFRQWRMSGLWKTVNDHLRSRARLAAGREALPSAAIMDSQSARTTEKGGRAAGTATNT